MQVNTPNLSLVCSIDFDRSQKEVIFGVQNYQNLHKATNFVKILN